MCMYVKAEKFFLIKESRRYRRREIVKVHDIQKWSYLTNPTTMQNEYKIITKPNHRSTLPETMKMSVIIRKLRRYHKQEEGWIICILGPQFRPSNDLMPSIQINLNCMWSLCLWFSFILVQAFLIFIFLNSISKRHTYMCVHMCALSLSHTSTQAHTYMLSHMLLTDLIFLALLDVDCIQLTHFSIGSDATSMDKLRIL